jgi:hypothetical protein
VIFNLVTKLSRRIALELLLQILIFCSSYSSTVFFCKKSRKLLKCSTFVGLIFFLHISNLEGFSAINSFSVLLKGPKLPAIIQEDENSNTIRRRVVESSE